METKIAMKMYVFTIAVEMVFAGRNSAGTTTDILVLGYFWEPILQLQAYVHTHVHRISE